jgi:hypothetical protein
MKKTVVIISILLLIFFCGLYVIYSKNKIPEVPIHEGNLTYDSIKNDYTELYEIDSMPTRLDSISFSVSFKINSNKKRRILSLPNAGSETGITITSSQYSGLENNPNKALAEGSFYINEPVLIDITSLKKGKYIIGIYGCDIAGIISMSLE